MTSMRQSSSVLPRLSLSPESLEPTRCSVSYGLRAHYGPQAWPSCMKRESYTVIAFRREVHVAGMVDWRTQNKESTTCIRPS